jgi:hypothetical protein
VIAGLILFEQAYPGVGVEWADTAINGALRAVLLVVSLGVLQLLVRAQVTAKALTWGIAFLLILGVDVLTHMSRQNPTVPPDFAVQPNSPDIRQARGVTPPPDIGLARAVLTVDAQRELTFHHTDDLAKDFLVWRLSLAKNTNLLDGLAKVDGFYSLYLGDTYKVTHQLLQPPYGQPEPLLDFLCATHITSPKSPFEWDQRNSAMPLLTIGQKPVFADDQTAFEAMFKPTFRPRDEVFLPREAKTPIGEREPAQGEVSNLQVAPHRISATLAAEQPTLAVIAQGYYHPWKVRIDGEPARIWRANLGFQAVAIPAGSHQLELTYEDRAFQIGGAISIITLTSCLAGLWLTWRARVHASRGP